MLTPLEGRRLLSGVPAAVWVGQDGHDLAGGATPLTGNGVQDIHVVLSDLPAGRSIRSMEIRGYGGGGWVVNGPTYYAAYSGALVRADGASNADLYLDPYEAQTGRSWTVTLTYDDSSVVSFPMDGGAADPNLRMPADAVASRWLGQDGHDLTGPGAAVGPDGIQDAHLTFSHLFPGTAVSAVTVVDAAGHGWESGLNPSSRDNAEFVRDASDPTKGDLFLSPDRDLTGQVLNVTVTYADGKTDPTSIIAGKTDPGLKMPDPTPVSVSWDTFRARWVGQDGLNLVGPGDVHLALDGLPAGRTVVSATVSDEAGIDWSYARPGSGASPADPGAWSLGFRAAADTTRADLGFPPARDETGATLTILVRLDDGSMLATRLPGGASDPGLRAQGVAATSVVAHPGDDLNDLANRYGNVRLVAGLYPMSRPLVLNHPVSLTADPGVTLLFSQGVNDPAWAAAIKVRASHTTLDGFAVRFAGPVRWSGVVSYGPAVVGTADNLDPWSADPLLDLAFTHLDLQTPPPATAWEEAPHLFRLVSAGDGRVSDNRLKGGITELAGGPWQVTGNTYLGTPPGTFAYAAFATHYSHDVTIAGNRVAPTGASGKTWRFLVMTQSGIGDLVRDNTVVGVGPMDADTVANPNASEVILTESYRLHYEGLVSSVSADGLLVQVPAPQGGQARTGDVVAILSGPQAGQWRSIAQVINPSTYLLDSPIMPGRFAVSLATGFVGETYQGNTVDSRGSSTSAGLVLAGNQYGAAVVGNHWLGGNDSFWLSAYPSEAPDVWGWTHAPFLGATVKGNTSEDALRGGLLDVGHNPYTKTDAGRVYFSATFLDNTGVWSAAFLAARPGSGVTDPPALVTVGDSLSTDPGELVLTASGNLVQGPPSVQEGQTFAVVSGTVNGEALRNVKRVLPSPSPNPRVGVPAAGAVGPEAGNHGTGALPGPAAVDVPKVAPRAVAKVAGGPGAFPTHLGGPWNSPAVRPAHPFAWLRARAGSGHQRPASRHAAVHPWSARRSFPFDGRKVRRRPSVMRRSLFRPFA